MTEFVTFDHAPDSKRYWVVRRPGIAVSLTAVSVPADWPLPSTVTFVVAPDGRRLVADCITVHRPGDDRECPALPGGCDSLGEAMPGAARLLREWAADACQPHSIADALVDMLHRETGEATAPTAADRAQAAAEQLPTVGRWPHPAPTALDWAAVRAERDRLRELVAKREREIDRLRAELHAETTPLGPLDEPEIGGTVRDRERDQWKRLEDGLWRCYDADTDSFGSGPLPWLHLLTTWGPTHRVLKAAGQ